MGDKTEYAHPSKKGAVICNGVVVVRSLQWPGAYSFYHNETWHQVYLGTGHKFEQASCYPVSTPKVLEDPEEFPLGPEPTPLEEPEVKEGAKEGEEDGEAAEDE